jgi:hypothetical protein
MTDQNTTPASATPVGEMDITFGFASLAIEPITSPFPRLPAEMRNQIYGYASAPSERPINMSLRRGAEVVVSRPDTYIGLSTVNRQVRAEFRPLFFSSHKGRVKIRLNELAQFLQALFPDGRVNAPLRLVIVEVKKGETDTQDWDMLPLLYAKARSSNVEF